MKVYSYITQEEGKITAYNPAAINEKATLSFWSTDNSDSLLSFSDAVPASFEQIDDRAEREGLNAWFNGH